jgi:hypothetical protein
MVRWVALAADWLRPIYEQIRTGVMAGGYVQVDETPIRYLAPGHGQTRHGYLWAYSRPGGDMLFDCRSGGYAVSAPREEESASARCIGRPVAPLRAWITSSPSTLRHSAMRRLQRLSRLC